MVVNIKFSQGDTDRHGEGKADRGQKMQKENKTHGQCVTDEAQNKRIGGEKMENDKCPQRDDNVGACVCVCVKESQRLPWTGRIQERENRWMREGREGRLRDMERKG